MEYGLEVDPQTAIFTNLKPALASDEWERLEERNREEEFFARLTKLFRVRLADGLSATLGGEPLKFVCERHEHKLVGERPEQHLRCDFVFRADWPTVPVAIFRFLGRPGADNVGTAMALCVVLMALVVAASLVSQRGLGRSAR